MSASQANPKGMLYRSWKLDILYRISAIVTRMHIQYNTHQRFENPVQKNVLLLILRKHAQKIHEKYTCNYWYKVCMKFS